MEIIAVAPAALAIDTNGKRSHGDMDEPHFSLGCCHAPVADGDRWMRTQLHATLRRARYAADATLILSDAHEAPSLRHEPAFCLSCDFHGRREDLVDETQCFMTHAFLTNHHFALLPRPKQLYCARCLDCVYPDALLAITQLTTPSRAPHRHRRHPSSRSLMLRPSQRTPSLRRRLMRSAARRGLVNMGNTCFMNAVLQALAHNPLVQHEYFVVRGHNTTICEQTRRQNQNDGPMAPCMGCEMSSLLQTLFPAPRATLTARHLTSPVVPQAFMETFWASAPSFVGSQQQDAHEFLVTLLNSIHRDTCPRTIVAPPADGTTKPSPTSPRFSATGQSLCDCVVHHNFAGVFSSEIACVFCDTVSSKFDPFLDITLPVEAPVAHKSKSNGSRAKDDEPPAPLTLESLLEQFTVEERLKGLNQIYCRRCSRYVDAMKRLVIHKLPNLLVLHLGRFDFAKNRKITDAVEFPLQGLDLREYCSDGADAHEVATPSGSRRDAVAAEETSGRSSPGTPPLSTARPRDAMYDLAAVISHHGESVKGGHFTAFVHSAQESTDTEDAVATSPWLHFDDSDVERVASEQVAASQAYLLFYVRRRLFV